MKNNYKRDIIQGMGNTKIVVNIESDSEDKINKMAEKLNKVLMEIMLSELSIKKNEKNAS